nr:MAG TPA: hypothetical protein [Caudoviricetes sp.]
MEVLNKENSNFRFYKKKDNNKIWSVEEIGYIGKLLYSFDKKNIYNLWTDYPHNFTKEEKELFDKENPYWKEFFSGRDQRTIEDYKNE